MQADVDVLHVRIGGRVQHRYRPAYRDAGASIDDDRVLPVGEIGWAWNLPAPIADIDLLAVRRNHGGKRMPPGFSPGDRGPGGGVEHADFLGEGETGAQAGA